MPFRASFECLWCGDPWTVRGPDDLEGFAQLCPTCIGRAGENGFLRFRLKVALAERAAAGPGGSAGAPQDDDWYLRRGRHARGPVHDQAWAAELDTATLWLDGLPWSGEMVELAAGTGWWSPLLASKGELSIYDAADGALDRARERLIAHRLRAHIHVRDAWAEPDRAVDGLFLGFWLNHVPRARLGESLALARRWLKPGGMLAFIDSRIDPQSGADLQFESIEVHHDPERLEPALLAAGFAAAEVSTTPRFFVMGRARA